MQKHDRLAVSSDLGLVLEASGGNPIEHSYSSVERVIYREVQQDFTTEIDVLCLTDGILIIERGLINRYFNFRSKIQLDHPVLSVKGSEL